MAHKQNYKPAGIAQHTVNTYILNDATYMGFVTKLHDKQYLIVTDSDPTNIVEFIELDPKNSRISLNRSLCVLAPSDSDGKYINSGFYNFGSFEPRSIISNGKSNESALYYDRSFGNANMSTHEKEIIADYLLSKLDPSLLSSTDAVKEYLHDCFEQYRSIRGYAFDQSSMHHQKHLGNLNGLLSDDGYNTFLNNTSQITRDFSIEAHTHMRDEYLHHASNTSLQPLSRAIATQNAKREDMYIAYYQAVEKIKLQYGNELNADGLLSVIDMTDGVSYNQIRTAINNAKIFADMKTQNMSDEYYQRALGYEKALMDLVKTHPYLLNHELVDEEQTKEYSFPPHLDFYQPANTRLGLQDDPSIKQFTGSITTYSGMIPQEYYQFLCDKQKIINQFLNPKKPINPQEYINLLNTDSDKLTLDQRIDIVATKLCKDCKINNRTEYLNTFLRSDTFRNILQDPDYVYLTNSAGKHINDEGVVNENEKVLKPQYAIQYSDEKYDLKTSVGCENLLKAVEEQISRSSKLNRVPNEELLTIQTFIQDYVEYNKRVNDIEYQNAISGGITQLNFGFSKSISISYTRGCDQFLSRSEDGSLISSELDKKYVELLDIQSAINSSKNQSKQDVARTVMYNHEIRNEIIDKIQQVLDDPNKAEKSISQLIKNGEIISPYDIASVFGIDMNSDTNTKEILLSQGDIRNDLDKIFEEYKSGARKTISLSCEKTGGVSEMLNLIDNSDKYGINVALVADATYLSQHLITNMDLSKSIEKIHEENRYVDILASVRNAEYLKHAGKLTGQECTVIRELLYDVAYDVSNGNHKKCDRYINMCNTLRGNEYSSSIEEYHVSSIKNQIKFQAKSLEEALNKIEIGDHPLLNPITNRKISFTAISDKTKEEVSNLLYISDVISNNTGIRNLQDKLYEIIKKNPYYKDFELLNRNGVKQERLSEIESELIKLEEALIYHQQAYQESKNKVVRGKKNKIIHDNVTSALAMDVNEIEQRIKQLKIEKNKIVQQIEFSEGIQTAVIENRNTFLSNPSKENTLNFAKILIKNYHGELPITDEIINNSSTSRLYNTLSKIDVPFSIKEDYYAVRIALGKQILSESLDEVVQEIESKYRFDPKNQEKAQNDLKFIRETKELIDLGQYDHIEYDKLRNFLDNNSSMFYKSVNDINAISEEMSSLQEMNNSIKAYKILCQMEETLNLVNGYDRHEIKNEIIPAAQITIEHIDLFNKIKEMATDNDRIRHFAESFENLINNKNENAVRIIKRYEKTEKFNYTTETLAVLRLLNEYKSAKDQLTQDDFDTIKTYIDQYLIDEKISNKTRRDEITENIFTNVINADRCEIKAAQLLKTYEEKNEWLITYEKLSNENKTSLVEAFIIHQSTKEEKNTSIHTLMAICELGNETFESYGSINDKSLKTLIKNCLRDENSNEILSFCKEKCEKLDTENHPSNKFIQDEINNAIRENENIINPDVQMGF